MSMAGKITVIRSIVASKLTYVLSTLSSPDLMHAIPREWKRTITSNEDEEEEECNED